MAYDVLSPHAGEFIDHDTIVSDLRAAEAAAQSGDVVRAILTKANMMQGITPFEAAVLLKVSDDDDAQAIYALANRIKETIYGRRVVVFAPLYLSDHCVNNCRYCGYKVTNKTPRRALTQAEIAEEVKALEAMGHKRLALEVGEHPVHASIDYMVESIATIYKTLSGNGAIRRVNVNVAATTEQDYARLKEAGIGTYILFQETYHRPTYEHSHISGPKSNYDYHTEAMDRAMRAGIDDVGIGALFGLYDADYDALGLLYHALHLEAVFGVGPHTVSVPRIKPAEGADNDCTGVDDDKFARLVAVLRIALPYTGLILSTREEAEVRRALLHLGVSQISAGSQTGVGGYTLPEAQAPQFEVSDTRSMDDILRWLCEDGFVPSFCTACYREGRVGDRFMQLAKNGQIKNICQPNALITLKEYLCDYASDETKAIGEQLIEQELERIGKDTVRDKTKDLLGRIADGQRDFRF